MAATAADGPNREDLIAKRCLVGSFNVTPAVALTSLDAVDGTAVLLSTILALSLLQSFINLVE